MDCVFLGSSFELKKKEKEQTEVFVLRYVEKVGVVPVVLDLN